MVLYPVLPLPTTTFAYLRLDDNIQRGGRWCRPHCHRAQRASKMKEGVDFSHGDQQKTGIPARALNRTLWRQKSNWRL